jgi:hypothetical protein
VLELRPLINTEAGIPLLLKSHTWPPNAIGRYEDGAKVANVGCPTQQENTDFAGRGTLSMTRQPRFLTQGWPAQA